MKVLFTDSDGVLNTRPGSLDGDKLDLIAHIVRETGCKVVISSSWRKYEHMLKRLKQALLDRGVSVFDVTPQLEFIPGQWCRSFEIDIWLRKNRHTSYAIIDDWDIPQFRNRLIRTYPNEGLRPDQVESVIELLNAPL